MTRSRRPLLAGAVMAALAVCHAAAGVRAEPVRFAVYGDMPYSAADQRFLEGPAADRIRDDATIAFVVNVGDLGRPETACEDSWQMAQRALWRGLFMKPVLFTPGDNDWTDCDRATVPNRGSELERLGAVRRIHFAAPPALPPEWRYRSQAALPENALWWHHGVRFVTLHVVGTSNGRRQVLLDDGDRALAAADARDAANGAWLDEAFRAARAERARAVVVAMQADPFQPAVDGGVVPATAIGRCLANPAYGWLCRRLETLSREFAGPVLLAHGDTSQACFEPIADEAGRTLFWRLNAWGDGTAPNVALVEVDPSDRDRPFAVRGLADAAIMPDRCDY